MAHHHSHSHRHADFASGDRRVLLAIVVNGLLTVAQVVAGILSGSLALIADALHNLSDMASLVIGFTARKVARRPADARMSFGYARVEVVAALVNYTTLILVGAYLIYAGMMRIIDPTDVTGWVIVVVAALALMVDAITALLTYSMQKGSVNIRALFLHNLSDALASIAVMLAGTMIILFDAVWVDPAITIGIAAYILYLGVTEIGGPIRTLMLGSPPDIDGEAVIARLRKIDGVQDVHHVHLWQMQEHEASLDAHVVLTEKGWQQLEAVKAELKAALGDGFGILHSTLEFEHPEHAHTNANTFGHVTSH